MSDARDNVMQLMTGFWHTAVVHAMASLGIADAVGDGVKSSALVAQAIGVDAAALYRLMRAAAALGLVEQHDADRFSLSASGALLCSGVPGSVRGMAMHVGGDLYRAFGDLAHCVKSGAPPTWIQHGPSGFAALNDDPQAAAIFNQAMVDGSRAIAEQAASAYDFGRFDRVMDVGGGYGAVLAVLLNRYAHQRGVILDLPHGQAGAEVYLAKEGVVERARYQTGSFFDAVPAEADCYVLKYIIHDWNDDYALQILRHCATAAKVSGGVVVLIERIVPERIGATQADRSVVRSELTMMLWAGKERTEAEFRALFAAAGLELSGITPLADSLAVIEARPV